MSGLLDINAVAGVEADTTNVATVAVTADGSSTTTITAMNGKVISTITMDSKSANVTKTTMTADGSTTRTVTEPNGLTLSTIIIPGPAHGPASAADVPHNGTSDGSPGSMGMLDVTV